MGLTERERLILHVTQLANSKSHDKLDMHLGSSINIIITNRCRSLTKAEVAEVFKDVEEELSFSAVVYDEYKIH
jgi:hypothetical protein